MDCQRPTKNEKTNKWEVWDFAYEENGGFGTTHFKFSTNDNRKH